VRFPQRCEVGRLSFRSLTTEYPAEGSF